VVEGDCAFVAANTRVAPVKPLSIPRLELQAAVLGVRLASMIQKEHDYEISSTHYWRDSSAVIGQIRGDSKRHLPSLPTDVMKFLMLQNRNNGVTALMNLILQMTVAVA